MNVQQYFHPTRTREWTFVTESAQIDCYNGMLETYEPEQVKRFKEGKIYKVHVTTPDRDHQFALIWFTCAYGFMALLVLWLVIGHS